MSGMNEGAIYGTTSLVPLVDGHTDATTLTVANVSGCQIHNIGQGANNVTLTLPAAAAGYSFMMAVGEPSSNYWKVTGATGTLIVNGTQNQSYAQFATPTIGSYLRGFTFPCAPQTSGLITATTLSQGSTPAYVASTAFTFYIGITEYAKAGVPAGTAPNADTIPQNKYGAWAFDINASGTISAASAANNATGYTTPALALADIPAVNSAKARMGTVVVINTNAAFVGATTSLTASGVTATYASAAVYTATYNWIITTGAGTVTSG
jgi:hypothetical protein